MSNVSPTNDLAGDGSAREIARRTVGIVKRQIPVSFLVIHQLTGNDLIIKSADLCQGIAIKNSYAFTQPFRSNAYPA
jgi:hypothetical protein